MCVVIVADIVVDVVVVVVLVVLFLFLGLLVSCLSFDIWSLFFVSQLLFGVCCL